MVPWLAVSVSGRQLLPKADSSPSDCEDSISLDVPHLRFAVADGATEAFDSRRWARYLTRAWILRSSTSLDGFGLVEAAQVLGQRLNQKWTGRQLPWYLEEKAASGAFAAFLGLQLKREGTWSAVAIGDVCLIIETSGAVQTSFPVSSADDFSSRPILVGSKADAEVMKQALRFGQGVCLSGDVLLLMTDAIACWYLRHATANRDLLAEFHASLGDTAAFSTLVDRERTQSRLRNDDVAVVRLTVGDTEHGG